jgi:mitochondrial fission protein ELM1
VGFPFIEKRLAIRAPWRHLSPELWLAPLAALSPSGDALVPPWPDLVIACGRQVVAPVAAAKRASGDRLFWVQVQDPRSRRDRVDLMVVPEHDPAQGDKVVRTRGAVHRVTAARLAEARQRWAGTLGALPRPLVAVLLGGDNRVYRLTPARLATLADQLAGLGRRGFGLAITPSRRTDAGGLALLRQRLAGLPATIWDGTGDNPYFGLLAHADAILVTADSVSMVSEAAATGKPVHIIALDGGSAKFARFHGLMRDAGVSRPFAGEIETWCYPPLDDTGRAAAAIRRRLAERLGPIGTRVPETVA